MPLSANYCEINCQHLSYKLRPLNTPKSLKTRKNAIQHCPICKQVVNFSSRYPDYICADCLILACDDKEKAVLFYNSSTSGHGCKGIYRLANLEYKSNLCFIKGIRCKAEEAYFGGIVIRPYKHNNLLKIG